MLAAASLQLGLQPPHTHKAWPKQVKEPVYIQDVHERNKYFVDRIKAIRQRVETFARCTGENILVIAVDETGQAHHWGTGAFQKFVQDERVAEIMYQYLNDAEPEESVQPPPMPVPDDPAQVEHLRSLLRAKVSEHVKRSGLGPTPNWSLRLHKPPQWPREVDFIQPSEMDCATVIKVLKPFFINLQQQAKAVGLREALAHKAMPLKTGKADYDSGEEPNSQPMAIAGPPMLNAAAVQAFAAEPSRLRTGAPAQAQVPKKANQEDDDTESQEEEEEATEEEAA